MADRVVRRGDIFFADLSPVRGSEQGGIRPVLILQNDIGNRYSPTTIVCPITSRTMKTRLPIHVELRAEDSALARDSVILLEQVRTIDKQRLREWVAHLDPAIMARVDAALEISLGLREF
ncbi:endoribonuclease toxin [Candidatus Hydrogenisulfobacillus filiaventi]|uniref:mRNA interferase n=1 Tax=Candidatus Hydrogenisulfobacillus filiaventi TaxID=2707344 RepID=A0A6F8ZIL6_9FIRM|nr:type II toxin-antitoxin system PemK/MazF family toxin [Bacillota bacterium]CAB1129291.1 endoribonuclease toxin [Candidatus Hydrogenisulfobacillus filiaventi]